jgi:hypothetical protein
MPSLFLSCATDRSVALVEELFLKSLMIICSVSCQAVCCKAAVNSCGFSTDVEGQLLDTKGQTCPGNCGHGCDYIQIFKTVLNKTSRLSDSIIRALNTDNIESTLSADFFSTHNSPSLTGISYLTCFLTRGKTHAYTKGSRMQYSAFHVYGMYVCLNM